MESVFVKKDLYLTQQHKDVNKFVGMDWLLKCNVMMVILIIMMDVILIALLWMDSNVKLLSKAYIVKINNV